MPEPMLVLLDQNVPRAIVTWLGSVRPAWEVRHVADLGLDRASDFQIYEWAQREGALIVTFDEDFADQRAFRVGMHHGIIRLRVWPTTIEETQSGLQRLLAAVTDEELAGALVIIDPTRIRVRRGATR